MNPGDVVKEGCKTIEPIESGLVTSPDGRITKVSSDLLIRLLAALGYRVRVVVSRTAA